MDLVLFFKGMFCGFVIAAPVGPVGILCAKRTLQLGIPAGLLSGFGAASADAIYGIVAAFGLHFVAEFLLAHSDWIRLVGGILMIAIGAWELFTQPREKGAHKRLTVNGAAGWYGSTFLLTVTNPITLISFGAVFVVAEAVVKPGNLAAAWILIVGVFAGSALWFSSLTAFSRLLQNVIDAQGLRVLGRTSGALVILFGLVVLFSLTDLAHRTFGY